MAAHKIPVVDFQQFAINQSHNVGAGFSEDVCGEIMEAFKNIGFVYLKNTGISQQEIDFIHEQTRKFFSLDEQDKAKCTVNSETGTGWSPMAAEAANPKRPGDIKECFDFQLNKNKNWPDESFPEFKEIMLEFFEKCSKLAHRVLHVIGIGLQVTDKIDLCKLHQIMEGKTTTSLRLLSYPPVPPEADIKPDQIRLGEHSDWGSITLLFQDSVGGLEVEWLDGVYRPATPIDGTVLVNIGDLLQRWTADTLVSMKHRILIPEEEARKKETRLSVVYFVFPDDDMMIECLDGSNKYPPVAARDYNFYKLNEAYGWD